MLQEKGCNVVMCGDLNCKLCTATRPGEAAASTGQAYIVYTCESPKCSLCREETDVLLDLFCPFNSIQDIKEMSRKIINITGIEDFGEETEIESLTQPDLAPIEWYGERASNIPTRAAMPRNDGSVMIRELLQSTPGNIKKLNNDPDLDITQNLKIIDETLLTELERELQVDQLNVLPELMNEGISEFI